MLVRPLTYGTIDQVQQLEFDRLDETEFEGFCFELLGELGFVNLDWRKSTALKVDVAFPELRAAHPRPADV